VLLMPVASAILWGASAIVWVTQRYQTPFSGEISPGATGATLRPELVPLALAMLAAVAAVLATGGWFRRLIGVLVLLTGGLLVWRAVGWYSGGPFAVPAPPGSTTIGAHSINPAGLVLMSVAGLVLVVAGLLVVLRGHRMPAMGAKYSAPGARKTVRDPDRVLWEALDQGEDPTDERE
jgi:uncharacterized membrane protein (TIGR02234 family)